MNSDHEGSPTYGVVFFVAMIVAAFVLSTALVVVDVGENAVVIDGEGEVVEKLAPGYHIINPLDEKAQISSEELLVSEKNRDITPVLP